MSDSPSKISLLSPKRQAFVREYLVDLNGTQAAIRAGYAENSAAEQATRLLSNEDVKAAVQEGMDERAKKVGVSAEKVLKELDCMSHYDPGEFAKYEVKCVADIAKLPEHLRRAIVGWSWDKHNNFVLKLASKTSEINLIGKHLKMWNEVGSAQNPLTIGVDDASTLELANRLASIIRAAKERKATGEKPEAKE